MLRVALKDLLAHKRRLITTGIAVILGIAFLTGTQILGSALDESIRSMVSQVYQGYDAVVRSPSVQETAFGEIRGPVDAAAVEEARAAEGVRAAFGVVESPTIQLIGSNGKVVGAGFGPPTLAFTWFDDPIRPGTLREGRGPESDDEIALDFKTAKDNGWEIGDEVPIATQSGEGTYRLVGVVGLGEDAENYSGAHPVYFTDTEARRLGGLADQYNYIAVGAEDGVSQEQLAASLAAAIPDQQVVTGDTFVEESQDAIASFVGILTTLVTVFGIISLVVAVFIIYNTFSIIVAQRTRETALLRAIGAHRRQVILATLVEALAIGVVASVVGLALGLLLAMGIIAAIGEFFTTAPGLPPLGLSTILTALAVGLVVTSLSAVIPAIRSSRIPPIAALSEVSLDRSNLSRARVIWGIGLIVGGIVLVALGLTGAVGSELYVVGAGLLLVLISVAVVIGPVLAAPAAHVLSWPFRAGGRTTGRLAEENAARNPSRTAATAAALTVGVTVVTVIAVLASTTKSSFAEEISGAMEKVDYIVTAGNFSLLGVPEEVAPAAAEIDGVEIVSPTGFGFLRLLDEKGVEKASSTSTTTTTLPEGEGEGGTAPPLGVPDDAPPGEDVIVTGLDPGTYFDVIDMGEVRGDLSKLDDASIVAREAVAEERGWKIGDEIPVFFTATGRQTLRLGATYSNGLGPNDNYYLPLETLRANALPGFDVDFAVYIGLAEHADSAAVKAQLESLVADRPDVIVQDRQEFVESQTAVIDVIVGIMYGLLALAVVIALIGVANTLSLSVLERTREFGLLRAVGMSRSQLRWTVRFEAAIVAVFGTLLGMVIGIAFAAAIVAALAASEPGLVSFRLPVTQLVVITVMAAIAGIVAAIFPARRAARLDVLDAISSE
jgi:putative ABC transport system permease protein